MKHAIGASGRTTRVSFPLRGAAPSVLPASDRPIDGREKRSVARDATVYVSRVRAERRCERGRAAHFNSPVDAAVAMRAAVRREVKTSPKLRGFPTLGGR